MPKHSVLLNNVCPKEEIVNCILTTPPFFLSAPNWPMGRKKHSIPVGLNLSHGGREISNLSHTSHSVSPKE